MGLFERHFFDESHFFRVLPSNLVQFGISYSEDEGLQEWAKSPIVDDPRREDIPFDRSIISFAGNGPNSRTSQLFITYQPNEYLGREVWEVPVGKVVDDGMEKVVDNFYSYGDSPPWGDGPSQHEIHGNPDYIMTNFPRTDAFGTCFVKRYDELEVVKEELLDKVAAASKEHQQQKVEAQQQQQQRDETATDGVLTIKNHIAYLLDGDQSTLQLLGLSAISVVTALLLVVIVVVKNNKISKSNSSSTSSSNRSDGDSGANRKKTETDNFGNENERKKDQ